MLLASSRFSFHCVVFWKKKTIRFVLNVCAKRNFRLTYLKSLIMSTTMRMMIMMVQIKKPVL